METIWDDISRDNKKLKSLAWHEDVLKDREAAVKSGKAKFSDWEEAKIRIKRNVSTFNQPLAP